MVRNLCPPTNECIQPEPPDRHMRRDLKTLASFVTMYCDKRHGDREKSPVILKAHDLSSLAGRTVCLCAECTKLLSHAIVKRVHCPLDPKPACKRCPKHCYAPKYRRTIQQVMRYSGREMLLSGRLDYLFHLLF